MDNANKLQYFSELKESLHLSGSKYRPGGRMEFNVKHDFLFDPSSESS
jgi:hypothetical protein